MFSPRVFVDDLANCARLVHFLDLFSSYFCWFVCLFIYYKILSKLMMGNEAKKSLLYMINAKKLKPVTNKHPTNNVEIGEDLFVKNFAEPASELFSTDIDARNVNK